VTYIRNQVHIANYKDSFFANEIIKTVFEGVISSIDPSTRSVVSPLGGPSVLKEVTGQVMTYVHGHGGPGRRYEVSGAGTCAGARTTWPRPVAHAAVARSVTHRPAPDRIGRTNGSREI
jgi:hypothetical protein